MTQSSPTPDYDRQPASRSTVPFLALRFTWPFLWAGAILVLIIVLVLLFRLYYENGSPYGFVYWFFTEGAALSISGLLACGVLAYIFVVIALILRSRRRSRAIYVLGYLDQAVRLNLSLPRIIAAAAASETGKMSRILRAFGKAASIGYPLAKALDDNVPDISNRAVALIAAGESSGRLAPTLARLISRERSRREPYFERRAFLIFYPAFLLIFSALVVIGLVVMVFPKFREIFDDFRVTPSGPFRWVIGATSWVTEQSAALLLMALGLIILWLVGRGLGKVFDFYGLYKRRSCRRNILADFILWHLPLARAWARDQGLGDVLTVLGDATRVGIPIPAALEQAAQLDLNHMLARQMQYVEVAVLRGMPLAEAARLAGLPKLVTGMWATAQASTSLPDTCDFLARYYRARFQRSVIFLQAALEPMIVLVMGCLVGVIALSIFTSLTQLINSNGDMWSIQ